MDFVITNVKTEEFSRNQIDEIRLGVEAGVDVSIYAKKEFLALQMQEIRLGLMDRLNVECYADTKYDWLQMEEIRKGLESGIDVNVYASPDISFDKMQQIRLGLEVGIDLSAYQRLDAGILKQLRLALLKRINIVPYIKAGYDADQLEPIRVALEKGLDISKWVKKEYRGVALQEIMTGLEDGVDVAVYAKVEYNWLQMKEIRLGLEHLIDVTPYENAFYNNKQMQEIRMGIEQGLDISYYATPMYTARDMRKRRLELEKNPTIAYKKASVNHSENEKKSKQVKYTVTISEDEMEAYLDIADSVKKIERVGIVKALHDAEVLEGILYEVIDDLVKRQDKRNNILVAKGKAMVPGENGRYEFFFSTEYSGTPRELENGSLDYQDLKWYETVREGQKLAYYHEAGKGINGLTVTGKVILAKRGKEENVLVGRGFKRQDDGKTYLADVSGIVTLKDYYLNVSEVLVLPEVNTLTGDIEYDGSVLIEGNVSSGVKIAASHDIIVNGYVEAAQIICGGNVVLVRGMNGMGGGIIKANGDVTGSFFEETEILAEGNIQGDYFFKSNLSAKGEIKAVGKKATIAGGSVVAEKGMKVFNLGNSIGLATKVVVGSGLRIKEKLDEMEETIRGVNHELSVLRNAHCDFQRKYSVEARNAMPIYLKIESAIYTKEIQMEELVSEKDRTKEELANASSVKIIVEGQIYEGVSVEIDEAFWQAKDARNVTLMRSRGRITMFSNYQA